jgi:hypothetical protein
MKITGAINETKRVIQNGYGRYNMWVGWCDKCRSFRVHVDPFGISYSRPTCALGHYSNREKLTAMSFMKKIKKQ